MAFNQKDPGDISWGEVFGELGKALSKWAFGGIFQGRSRYEASAVVEKDPSFEIRARAPREDELALGMAKVRDRAQNKEIEEQIGISSELRRKHMYVVGESGVGKTKFLESMIRQDIDQGRGFGVIDPHGDLIENVKAYLYEQYGEDSPFLRERVVLIDPTDRKRVVGFNPLTRISGKLAEELVGRLVLAFKKIWGESWGDRMAGILRYSLLVLCENGLTLAELPLLLTDQRVRSRLLENVTNTACRDYFTNEFGQKAKKTIAEWIEAPLNKTNAFLFDPRIRQILSSSSSTFDVRHAIDEKGMIVLVKLDQGQLVDAADIVGSLLISTFQSAAFARTDQLESERNQFFLYIDEFQNFATDDFIKTLNESRKYKLSLVLANQLLAQLPRLLQTSALGNCAIQAYFQVTHDDASILAREALAPALPEAGHDECVRFLQTLGPRELLVRNKDANAVQPVKTLEVEYPWGEDQAEEKRYRAAVNGAGIGAAFMREREELEREYQERRRRLLEGEGKDAEPFREREQEPPADAAEARATIAKRWPQIEQDLKAGDRAHLRNAVMESETLLEIALKAMGREGESVSERLSNVRPGTFSDFAALRQARHIRNSMTHDGFELTDDAATSAVVAYKQALVELGVLEEGSGV